MLYPRLMLAFGAVGFVTAQVEGDVHCDGLLYPDYDSCELSYRIQALAIAVRHEFTNLISPGDSIVSDNNWAEGEVSWDGQSPNNCQIWFGGGNCKFGYCFGSAGAYNNWAFPIYYQMVKQSCQSFQAGGRVHTLDHLFEVSNNGDYRPETTSRRRENVMSMSVSKQDYDILMNSTQTVESGQQAQPSRAKRQEVSPHGMI